MPGCLLGNGRDNLSRMMKVYPAFIERLAEISAPRPKKPCGGCTMCCHIIPVRELGLEAFTHCPHELTFPHARPGCAIYNERPSSCRVWSCQYALEGWDDELRPDRCGVVIDPHADLIRLTPTAGGETLEMPAAQFWAAPGYEDVFRRRPVLAAVLAALESAPVVVWRYRDPERGNVGLALLRDAETGELTHTAPFAESGDFGMSAGERMLHAEKLLRGGKRR